ncbi:MAG TPA: DUF4350 domain-containing protein, partial [Novosphingobium sp.]|nr:DUF4350 domain-containing protein [Novosphingobium sp.]
MSGQGPFSGKAALALVAAMGALLLGLAWLAGAAPAQVPAAGAHAGGRGLDGYAGLATLLEVAGYPVAVGSS